MHDLNKIISGFDGFIKTSTKTFEGFNKPDSKQFEACKTLMADGWKCIKTEWAEDQNESDDVILTWQKGQEEIRVRLSYHEQLLLLQMVERVIKESNGEIKKTRDM